MRLYNQYHVPAVESSSQASIQDIDNFLGVELQLRDQKPVIRLRKNMLCCTPTMFSKAYLRNDWDGIQIFLHEIERVCASEASFHVVFNCIHYGYLDPEAVEPIYPLLVQPKYTNVARNLCAETTISRKSIYLLLYWLAVGNDAVLLCLRLLTCLQSN